MATTLEIINGISQVLSNTYDGALDESIGVFNLIVSSKLITVLETQLLSVL